MARVLVIADTQSPFEHPKTLQFLKGIHKKHRCNTVVHIGDECDYKMLKYYSINDPHTAEQQHALAVKFMKTLYKAFPEVMVCNSNHGDRLKKAAEYANIPKFFIKNIHDYLEAPKTWQWRDYWVIDGVRYEHGHRFGGQKPHEKAVEANFQSTVIGHFAALLALKYVTKGDQSMFGAVAGSLTTDPSTRMGYGMKYSEKYANKPVLGCAVVIDGKQCILEPMV